MNRRKFIQVISSIPAFSFLPLSFLETKPKIKDCIGSGYRGILTPEEVVSEKKWNDDLNKWIEDHRNCTIQYDWRGFFIESRDTGKKIEGNRGLDCVIQEFDFSKVDYVTGRDRPARWEGYWAEGAIVFSSEVFLAIQNEFPLESISYISRCYRPGINISRIRGYKYVESKDVVIMEFEGIVYEREHDPNFKDRPFELHPREEIMKSLWRSSM